MKATTLAKGAALLGAAALAGCEMVIEAGADFLAVGAGVWNYADGPAAAVKAFNAKMSGGV